MATSRLLTDDEAFGQPQQSQGALLSDEQAFAAPKKAAPPLDPKQAYGEEATNPQVDTRFGTIKGEASSGFNPAAALIAAGGLGHRLNEGVKQLDNFSQYALARLIPGGDRLATHLLDQGEAQRQDMAEKKRLASKLETVNPGSATIGETAVLAPVRAAAMPLLAALEYGDPVERATRAGVAFAGQKVATEAGKYMGQAAERGAEAKAANASRDALVAEARTEGYVVPPSASGGGVITRTMEGVSGKAKTEQSASLKNQTITDRLAREDLGLAPDAPLNQKVLETIRKDAYAEGYAPIAGVQRIDNDFHFMAALQQLNPAGTGGAVRNPAQAEIDDMLNGLLNHKQWTGDQLIHDIRSLREQGRANFNSAARDGGNVAKTDLGRAQVGAADKLEELAERNIIAQGGSPGAVQAFREARKQIAKSHTIEDALEEGTNHVNAAKIRGDFLDGKLELISRMSGNKQTGKSVQLPQSGFASPVTALDNWGALGLMANGAGAMAFAAPAARVAAREAILARPAQRFMNPNYDPSWAVKGGRAMLDNRAAPALAGMYGLSL